MAKAGKIVGLISPVLALGIVTLMLFGSGCSYQSASCEASYGHESSERCTYESGTITAFRFALDEGDYAWLRWAVFVLAVYLIAAVGALAGRAAPVWVCAGVLISIHLLARELAEAYIAGDPTRPDGVIVQGGSDPGELMSFGSDAAVLWELLRLVEGWSYPPSHRAKGEW